MSIIEMMKNVFNKEILRKNNKSILSQLSEIKNEKSKVKVNTDGFHESSKVFNTSVFEKRYKNLQMVQGFFLFMITIDVFFIINSLINTSIIQLISQIVFLAMLSLMAFKSGFDAWRARRIYANRESESKLNTPKLNDYLNVLRTDFSQILPISLNKKNNMLL